VKTKRKKLNRLLLESVTSRDIEPVKRCLEQGAEIDARNPEHGETPLMLAARFADAAMVNLLIEAGAEIDARDDRGRTALFYAPVLSDKFDRLRAAGADVRITDHEGDSILMYRVPGAASLAEVDKLLEAGIDPHHQNEDGETALDRAEALGLIKVAERLRASAIDKA
jgi:ankyrin repeat protein